MQISRFHDSPFLSRVENIDACSSSVPGSDSFVSAANAVANNPGFVEMREIQYAKEVASTIAASNFKVCVGGRGSGLRTY